MDNSIMMFFMDKCWKKGDGFDAFKDWVIAFQGRSEEDKTALAKEYLDTLLAKSDPLAIAGMLHEGDANNPFFNSAAKTEVSIAEYQRAKQSPAAAGENPQPAEELLGKIKTSMAQITPQPAAGVSQKTETAGGPAGGPAERPAGDDGEQNPL